MIHRRARTPRRGMMIVAVLVCLVVVMLLAAALLRVALAERDGNRNLERRLQAEWLVESGLERARARLAADRGYTGETWPIAAAGLGLEEPSEPTGKAVNIEGACAVVTISVDRTPGAGGRARVRVQADYPRDGPRRARHSEERFIDLEPQKTGAMP